MLSNLLSSLHTAVISYPADDTKLERFDWRTVPNEELTGDCCRDAYQEKLCRSVEATHAYNAGRELDKQFSIWRDCGAIANQKSPLSTHSLLSFHCAPKPLTLHYK